MWSSLDLIQKYAYHELICANEINVVIILLRFCAHVETIETFSLHWHYFKNRFGSMAKIVYGISCSGSRHPSAYNKNAIIKGNLQVLASVGYND